VTTLGVGGSLLFDAITEATGIDAAELGALARRHGADLEIGQTTERLRALATAEEEHGYLPVRPEIVIEVAFDGLQRSDRHSSGFALRFPRIARLRDDKSPDAIDTIEAVRALWEAQVASGHREEAPVKKGRRSGRRPDVRKKSKQLRLFDDD
jgi:hypothetical protein